MAGVVRNYAPNIDSLPGGSKVARRIHKMHPAKRTAPAVLGAVQAQSADPQHARDLVSAIIGDSSLVTETVREGLQKLLESGSVDNLVRPGAPSIAGRIMACLGSR